MAGAFWYMSCEVISHTARILAEDFQKVKFIISHSQYVFLLLYTFFNDNDIDDDAVKDI